MLARFSRRCRDSIVHRSRHLIRTVRSQVEQHYPFPAPRSSASTCILCNAVPKSGTYLLHSLVNALGRWENSDVHFAPLIWMDKSGPTDIGHFSPATRSLRRLRNGQFAAAHLIYDRDVEKTIGTVTPNRHIRHIFMYRDPRDIYVSMTNFIATNERIAARNPKWRGIRDDMLASCANDDEMLSYVINKWPDLGMIRYHGWLASPACHAVRFEQLYADAQALKEGRIGTTLGGLLDYLGADKSTIDPHVLHSAFFNKSLTASSENEKVGQWRRRFTERHLAALDTPELKMVLQGFGYD